MESSSFKGDEDRAFEWNCWNLSTAGFFAAIAAAGNKDRTNPFKKCIVKKREEEHNAG
jgi:hypothetical protein